MKYKKLYHKKTSIEKIAFEMEGTWHILEKENTSLLQLLDEYPEEKVYKSNPIVNADDYKAVIPIKPTAYRDFMLYEKHAIEAARGFVKKYLPQMVTEMIEYEEKNGEPIPLVKPKDRYYKHPIYYMGNHLNFFTDGDEFTIPAYTKELDYELEIGAFITKPLKNATLEEVEDAIGGFVILNDFTARDVQLSEMQAGFGPMKAKNFGSAISSTIVGKELLSQINNLEVKVNINGETIMKNTSAGSIFSLTEAIAYASWEEQLHPGELFGSGTIPGCAGIENGQLLNPGDTIILEVEGIGTLTNKVR